ncbi:hypothetical protein DTO013E5_8357 [Penicillium roqueforti]|nr:hypothetical protein DTO013F2_8983 [Penicillium roqueforti]KAI2743432.1 hypothetical protein DTO012A1_3346 [Penicillium roqueforti]KAI2770199.1 hypothetical protein DTO012A8_4968 [Penicillium roqueforti]KAI3070025.1 hypothetical protein CBS147339_7538 [Penicillium roqueforti]KAI3090365.1 hypothetical protein CBS147338_9038 [Penicillium roqueforti]
MTLSLSSALEKLVQASRYVERRNGVKEKERKRIKAAATLLRNGYPPQDSIGAGRQSTYLDFLRKVRQLNGPSMVVLCAIGLGLSTISIAKESIRLDLPYEIQNHSDLDNPVLRWLARQYFSFALYPEAPQAPLQAGDGTVHQVSETHDALEHQERGQGSYQIVQPIFRPPAVVTSPDLSTFQPGKQQDIDPLTGDVYELNLQDIRDIIESGQISGAVWLTDTYGVNTTSFVTIPVSNELTDRLILHRPLATWNQPPN